MPNQYTTKTEPGQRQSIADFLRDHPRSSARDVHLALGYAMSRCCQELSVMKRLGMVRCERIDGAKSNRWALTADMEQACVDIDTPRRIITATWQCLTKRHPLDVALFGESGFGAAAQR